MEKEFSFRDFRTALNFVDQIGDLAEGQDHHPDHLGMGKVRVTLWAHAAKGLPQQDYVLAAKIDRLPL